MRMPDGYLYLDQAATSWPKPQRVVDAVREALEGEFGNPGRGSHRAAGRARTVIDRARAGAARLLHEPDVRRIILTPGCTNALNMAIDAVVTWVERDRAQRGDRDKLPPKVVTSHLEHNAVGRPVAAMECAGRVRMARAACDEMGVTDIDDLVEHVDSTTVLVCVIHASNVTGVIQPIEEIARRVKEKNPETLILTDAAQTTGVIPIDVNTLGVDLLAFGGHKGPHAPTGIGALWIGPRAWPRADSDEGVRLAGGPCGGTTSSAADRLGDVMPTRLPERFEAGTPNLIACAGLAAALEVEYDDACVTARLQHARDLIKPVLERFADDERVCVVTSAPLKARTPVVSLAPIAMCPVEIATILDASFNIAVRGGMHCSPWTHQALGTHENNGAVRVSVCSSCTPEEVDAFIGAMDEVLASVPA
ncbi:MAG: aminotransferase class V-fold PLP-dependent enzyme [Planctomycetota bacterium]